WQLDRGELIAVVGGILLGVSLFLNWYSLGNTNAVLNGCKGPNTTCTGWAALSVLRFLLLLAAAAPVILAWIIVRGHALSWPRGGGAGRGPDGGARRQGGCRPGRRRRDAPRARRGLDGRRRRDRRGREGRGADAFQRRADRRRLPAPGRRRG